MTEPQTTDQLDQEVHDNLAKLTENRNELKETKRKKEVRKENGNKEEKHKRQIIR